MPSDGPTLCLLSMQQTSHTKYLTRIWRIVTVSADAARRVLVSNELLIRLASTDQSRKSPCRTHLQATIRLRINIMVPLPVS